MAAERERVEIDGALCDRSLLVIPESPDLCGLVWRESLRSFCALKVGLDARACVLVCAERAVGGWSSDNRADRPVCKVLPDVDPWDGRWICGERVSRETLADRNERAAVGTAFVVLGLTCG